MPTYQYACTECGHQLEAVQSFSDPALTECPDCNGKLRKVFNSVGIVFKGSGFYRTDSRSGTAEKSNGNGDSSTKKTESTSSSSSSSSDSAPATSSSASSSSSSSTTSTSGGAKAAATS